MSARWWGIARFDGRGILQQRLSEQPGWQRLMLLKLSFQSVEAAQSSSQRQNQSQLAAAHRRDLKGFPVTPSPERRAGVAAEPGRSPGTARLEAARLVQRRGPAGAGTAAGVCHRKPGPAARQPPQQDLVLAQRHLPRGGCGLSGCSVPQWGTSSPSRQWPPLKYQLLPRWRSLADSKPSVAGRQLGRHNLAVYLAQLRVGCIAGCAEDGAGSERHFHAENVP